VSGLIAVLIVGVVGLTSVGFYLLGARVLGLSARQLPGAVRVMLECVGTIVVFSVVNLVVGAALILGLRLLSGRFVSLYLLEDETWWILSALQGLTWSMWRQTKASHRAVD
jgi:hypothetical protein